MTFHVVPQTTSFMGVKLLEELVENKQYYISFYVAPANCSSVCFSDAIGLAFSDTLFYHERQYWGEEFVPDFIPAVENPEGNILDDTLNWTKIGGCYTARGDEQYAIIGSFKPSSETFSAACVGVTGSRKYIDDVGVYKFDPLPDTLLLCAGDSARIGASFLDGAYMWNTGESDSTILVTQAGEYILTVLIDDCMLSDTVVVIETEKLLASLPADTLICRGDVFRFQIHMPGYYEWSTGATGDAIAIRQAGYYTVAIHNECGDFYHAIEVEEQTCSCDIFVPTAFSPNADGVNDELRCFAGCDYPFRPLRFQVFDRWGALVYSDASGNVDNIRWDGAFRGQPLGTGTYVWIFEYEYDKHGTTRREVLSGTTALVR
jgi:gliding motility-associated-like protein